jgi:hypothetical protein
MNAISLMTTQSTNLPSADSGINWNGSIPLDKLSALSMLYLGIPLGMFFAGWLRIQFALPLLLALVFGFAILWRNCSIESSPFRLKWLHLILLGVAIAWTAFGGAGHIFYANRFDWSLRDAVLRDLTVASWPPGYDIGEAVSWMLRCPVGYFLPAALAGKIFGLAIADAMLWIWTAIGVWIFLLLLPLDARRPARIGFAILIVVLFSGMDILGWWLFRQANPPMYKHLEWWAGLFQYSSNTTALFWTPNHALPGWIAAALFWRHWKTDRFISIAPLLLALMPIWSPFPMIGMAPFYLLLLFRVIRENKWPMIHWPLLAISVVMIGVVGAFLSTDIGGIPAGSALTQLPFGSFLIYCLIFVLFEFGILGRLLWITDRGQILAISVAFLILLPLVRFGPSNDLAMRASIPALIFLCISTINAFQNAERIRRRTLIALCFVLILGAITPLHEFYRAASLASWKPDYSVNVMNYGAAPAPHYVARVEKNWRRYLFRDFGGIIKTKLLNKHPYFLPQEIP